MRTRSLSVLQVFGGAPGWGGAERVALDLAVGLRDRGYRMLFASPQEETLARWREAGFDSFAVPLRSLRLARPVGRLVEILRRERVDVVHCHERRAAMSGFPAAALARAPARLLHVHSIASQGGARAAYALATGLLALAADAVVYCSEYVRRGVEPKWRPSGVVIPNGVAFPAVRPAPRLGRAPGPALLAAGRLAPPKGFDILLDAVANVVTLMPDTRLSIAGEGHLRADLEARRRRLGLEDHVNLLGFRRDLRTLMSEAGIFVMSSLWEGLPLALLEAVAAGTPVVATNVGAIPEIIVDGETGWLVRPGDADELAAAIIDATKHPAEAARRAQVAFAKAREDYSIEVMVERFHGLYRQLLSAKGPLDS